MGQRGPAPQPTALKKLHGYPGKRKLNTREPRPARAVPTCPAWLRDEAKAEWRRVAPELRALGLLTRLDRAALAAYCQAYARWCEAEVAVSQSAQLLKSSFGNVYINPALGAAGMAMKQMFKAAAQFGMTPSARSNLQVGEPEEADLADVLFRSVRDGKE